MSENLKMILRLYMHIWSFFALVFQGRQFGINFRSPTLSKMMGNCSTSRLQNYPLFPVTGILLFFIWNGFCCNLIRERPESMWLIVLYRKKQHLWYFFLTLYPCLYQIFNSLRLVPCIERFYWMARYVQPGTMLCAHFFNINVPLELVHPCSTLWFKNATFNQSLYLGRKKSPCNSCSIRW